MANNNNLFNAALSGAAAGVSSRVLQSSVSADYDSQATLIAAFATALDAAIAPIVGGGSQGQAGIISEISAAFWRDRIIPPGTSFTVAAANLAALYTALSPLLEPEAGGGGIEPLSTILATDPAATGTSTGAFSGGVDAAYADLNTAVDDANEGDSLFISPGDYSASPILSITTNNLSFLGQAYAENSRPIIEVDSWGGEGTWSFVNLRGNMNGLNGSTLYLVNCNFVFTNDENNASIIAQDSRLDGFFNDLNVRNCVIVSASEATVSPGNTWNFTDCSITGSLTLNTTPEAIITAKGCVFEGTPEAITTRELRLNDCTVTRAITVESIRAKNSTFFYDTTFEIARDFQSSFENCTFDSNASGAITLSGAVGQADIRFDSASWMSFVQSGWTITGVRGTEYNVVITDFTTQAQGNSAVPIPDDGVVTPILALPTYNMLGVVSALIFISADNGTDTADGTLILESDAGDTITIPWGPLAVGQNLAVPITEFNNDPTTVPTLWTLSATVTIGTGDCTVNVATMVMTPLQ